MAKVKLFPNSVSALVSLVSTIAACSPTASPCPAVASPAVKASLRGPVQHVLLVSVDGLKPETYLHPDEHQLKIPTLRWMASNGAVSAGVESVFPTVTYPSHTAMVTGANPARHGIFSNRTFDPLDIDLESWNWYAEDIKTDPIWRIAEQGGLETAMVHWPVSVGAKVDWLVPEYWRAKNENDQRLMRAISTPGLLDAVAKENPQFWARYVPPALNDDVLTDIALHVIRRAKPNLLLLHLVGVDGAQHRFGIDSTEARAAIEEDDRQIARLYQEIHRVGMANDTIMVVASDHGFRSAKRMVRPCTLLRQSGLVDTTEDGRVTGWRASVHSNSGGAYVYLKDRGDVTTGAALRGIFEARMKQAESGIGRIFSADEVRSRGGDPSAALALEAAEGYQFGGGCTGEYSAPAAYTATHGFDPKRPEMQASLLIQGPRIRPQTIPHARLIDIAPTIASWLGLPMPNAEGIPLVALQPER